MPPSARISDFQVCPMVTGLVPHVGGPLVGPGAAAVLVNGLPAARGAGSDHAVCCGPSASVMTGSSTVMIEGKPAARVGDTTSHGGTILTGSPNVIIGG
ncbi:MAG: PAAR domain-containing protein [Rhodobacteraceae bacterium]|nr:PAAR domain-containing protein [Paracoccaceae bacterium]